MEENAQPKTLLESMSIETIAEIKAKRLANKKDAIRALGLRVKKKVPQPDEKDNLEVKSVAEIAMARERYHRNRQELLMGENEVSGVLKTLSKVFDFRKRRLVDKTREASAKSSGNISANKKEQSKLREVPVVPPQLEPTIERNSKYNRYGQERFLKPVGVKGKEEFGINPLGTNIAKPSTSSSASRRRTSLQQRKTVLPIIVVPKALTSMVTLHNAKQLLQDMRYVSVDEMRQKGSQYLEEVIIERRVQGDILRYRVIDNVSRLKENEWNQVAAVFALGPHWQFKGWPHKGDPADIFHHVCAFHLHFKDSPIHKDLRNMQVNELSLPKYERHMDCGILMEFWNKLDQHIAHNHQQFAFMRQK
ncbi:parafibromin [Drosophila willistoni]|uniref:parafibromin n=1 Tax=Drosophila willistoni TaxID=7260 RepID=UPI00017D8521|nr:parafibromin [Drosophila willistoni]